MQQNLVFLSCVAAALAASNTPDVLGGAETSYTGSLALAYYSALNSFYGQPSVAAALSAAETIASDNTEAYNSWLASFYGTYNPQLQSIASAHADVFTQNGFESGAVSIPTGNDPAISSLLASATGGGSASKFVSSIASVQLKATGSASGSGSAAKSSGSGSDSKSSGSGSKSSGSDSKSSGSGSASGSGSSSGSGSNSASSSGSNSGSSSSTDNAGARSGSYMAAGGVAGVVALALL